MKSILVLRHVPHEDLGAIGDAIRAAGIETRYVDMLATPDESFHPEDVAGLIVLGGPMNVDETVRYPFLAKEVRWISAALQAETPILGICLGSQLLAKTLGARVYKGPIKEIGWYEVELLPAARNDRLLASAHSKETVFQWHGDTFDLPPGAVHLARGERIPHQAFRYGPSAYALQFHLEVTPAMIDAWLVDPENCCELAELDYIQAESIRVATPRHMPPMQELGQRVFGEFAAMCRGRA